MNNTFGSAIYFFLLFGLSFLPLLIFYFVDKKRINSKDKVSFYKIKIGNTSISLTRNALYQSIWWLCILYFLDFFLPLPISLPSILISAFIAISLVRASSNSSNSNFTSSTQNALSSLKDMQTRLSSIQSHIEELTVEIENRIIEVDEKQKLTQSLDEDINKKLKESEEWQNLSDSQKQLVINAAAEAINKKSISQNISFAVGAILLNLVATLIWTLFGNPGRKELADTLMTFLKSLLK